MGTIKDRNDKDLTEEENTKKSWQEYTEKKMYKDLNDTFNHDGCDQSFRAKHLGV